MPKILQSVGGEVNSETYLCVSEQLVLALSKPQLNQLECVCMNVCPQKKRCDEKLLMSWHSGTKQKWRVTQNTSLHFSSNAFGKAVIAAPVDTSSGRRKSSDFVSVLRLN